VNLKKIKKILCPGPPFRLLHRHLLMCQRSGTSPLHSCARLPPARGLGSLDYRT